MEALNKGLILSLLFLWVLLPSCQHDNLTSEYPYLNSEEELVTILFTEDSNNEPNSYHAYYDALIDFQQEHPEALSTVHSAGMEDAKLMQHYEVTDFPTMIILEEEEIQLRLEGDNEYTVIKDEIEDKVVTDEMLSALKSKN